ncbi:MAG: aminotransferase class V-fold PLP-dependent enzyme [Clostridia bacterium]|nr:aminotransferase class V-fold PLP-dependent enzyme [Clostridia bacterium]
MGIIYLDNAATTAPNMPALEEALSYAKENFFNPSAKYREAQDVSKKLNACHEVFLKAYPKKKVVFTSCGTEADNTAVFSFCGRGNVVTSLGEHSAVNNAVLKLKEKGANVRFAKLTDGGRVDVEDLLKLVDKDTSFVSIVHVNNETGAINDINTIAKKVKAIAPKCIFHSDGVQGFCKVSVKLCDEIDLYSVSAHKIGGLKGVGALIVNPKLATKPYLFGGGQENGFRSGTENVLGIVQFAKVFVQRYANIEENYQKVLSLKQILIDGLDKSIFRVVSSNDASPYIVSVSAVGLRGQILQNMLNDDGILVGTGSACSSKNPHSRIISSFIQDKKVLDGMLRISFSPETSAQDVKNAVERLNFNGAKLKQVIR